MQKIKGGIELNKEKSILMDYIDACELIRETEEDIQRLRKKEIVNDKVSGSNPEFPYQPQSFSLSGAVEKSLNDKELEKEKRLLQQRKENARQIKIKAEEIINRAPVRMQRIIRFKVFQHMEWEEVAMQMGGNSTGESVRKEFQRFLDKK